MNSIESILRLSDLSGARAMMSLRSCWHPPENEVYEAGTIVFLEGAPCYTISIIEWGKVALEMNVHIVRTKEEPATSDVITRGGCLCCSGLVESHLPTARAGTLETAEVNTLDTKELESVLEESPKTGREASKNLARVVPPGFERTKETLGRILSLIVECRNRIPLLVVDVHPEEHSRNGWRVS